MVEVGQAYVGEDGQWYYCTEKDVMKAKDALIDKVIHQLMKDWYDENDKCLARWLIQEIPVEKLEEYMQDVKEV